MAGKMIVLFGSIILLLVLLVQTGGVLMGQNPDLVEVFRNDTGSVWSCVGEMYQREIAMETGEIMYSCAKRNLYLGLMNNMDAECVDIGDGVTFIADPGHQILSPRDIFPSGEEPSAFRDVVDAYSTFLSQRAVRWDLGYLYPGLVMRIGPTMNGAGILEFVMEKRLDYHDRAKLGPGQLMVRRTILPHLLGFRMNLLSLLPIVFGIILYVAKNAFIFSKVTLILSTLMTLKSLYLLQHLRPPNQQNHDFVDTGGGDSVGVLPGIRPRPQAHSLFGPNPDNLLFQMITSSLPPFRGVNDKYLGERRDSGKRNFSWEK